MSDAERALQLVEALCPASSELRFLVLPGAPHSKGRPRFSRKGHAFTTAEDRQAELTTATLLRQMTPAPLYGNLAFACVFFRPNRQRIDCDNMLKHVCDAATGVLWHDDSQVTAIMGVVEYDAANPRTIVALGQHESTLVRDAATPLTCAQCGVSFVRRKAGQTICSKACRSVWQIGRNRSRATVLDPKCQVCGAAVSKPEVLRCRSCWAKRATETEPIAEASA